MPTPTVSRDPYLLGASMLPGLASQAHLRLTRWERSVLTHALNRACLTPAERREIMFLQDIISTSVVGRFPHESVDEGTTFGIPVIHNLPLFEYVLLTAAERSILAHFLAHQAFSMTNATERWDFTVNRDALIAKLAACR